MKILLFLFFIFSVYACNQPGRMPQWSTQALIYSASTMRTNFRGDSNYFFLNRYIEITKNGRFRVMRHDEWNSRPTYFTGLINDSMRKQVDSTFVNRNYQQTYFLTRDGIYDGLSYRFDYKIEGDSNRVIQFYLNHCPKQIDSLASILDTLIYSKSSRQADSFNVDIYKEKLSKLYPMPPRSEKTKVYKDSLVDSIIPCNNLLVALIRKSSFDPEIQKFKFKVWVDVLAPLNGWTKLVKSI